MQWIAPRLPLTLMTAVLAFLVINLLASTGIVIRGAEMPETNQQEHADLSRQIGEVRGDIQTMQAYQLQLQQANIRDRLTKLETMQQVTLSIGETIVRLMWAVLMGIIAMIGERVWGTVQARRAK